MDHRVLLWAAGLGVAVIGGHVAAGSLIWAAWGRINPAINPHRGQGGSWRSWRECIWRGTHIPAPNDLPRFRPHDPGVPSKWYSFPLSVPDWEASIPSWAMGVGERVFFTVAMGAIGKEDIAVGVGAIVAWVTIKSGVTWGRGAPPGTEPWQHELFVRKTVVSVAATMVSLFFALLGGLIVLS